MARKGLLRKNRIESVLNLGKKKVEKSHTLFNF